jgi:hypothetical protein
VEQSLGSKSGSISARYAEYADEGNVRPKLRINSIGIDSEIRNQQVAGSIPAGGSNLLI